MPYRNQCGGNQYPYVIQSGDTLYKIANRLGVSVSGITAANPGVDPYNLRVGQILCIPFCPPNHFSITMQTGDTLYNLAQKYKVSVESIIEANPSIDPNYLRVGQRICIPLQCDCEEKISAMHRDIDMLKAESIAQLTDESTYGSSTAKTRAVTVTNMLLQFDAVPVVFTGNYQGQFTEGDDYPYYLDEVISGQRPLVVKDNFGVWHTFTYYV